MNLGVLKNSTAYGDKKNLDNINFLDYNRITYHRYDRKELKWQGIETHMKLEKKY